MKPLNSFLLYTDNLNVVFLASIDIHNSVLNPTW